MPKLQKKINVWWFCNAILLTQFCPELLRAGLSHVLILFISVRLLMMRKWNCYLPYLETNYLFIHILPCRETALDTGGIFFDQVSSHRKLTEITMQGNLFYGISLQKYVLWQQHFFCHSNDVLKNWRYPFSQRKTPKCRERYLMPPVTQIANRKILYCWWLGNKWQQKCLEATLTGDRE